MISDNFLHYSVIICWALNILFLVRFARQWYEREPEKRGAWLALAAVALPALAVTCFLPARSGYDNNHSLLSLGSEFFTGNRWVLLSFKEVSPLFTDGVTDLLSGYSLSAILWKNRLLPVLSLFVFFTGLRRLGAGLTVSAAGAAFFFLNFLSLLNASSFSTTSVNILIWLVSLLALFDAWAASGCGAAALVWIMSSMLLVISARFEFLPVNLLFFAALLSAKLARGKKDVLNPLNVFIIAAGGCLLGLWAAHARGLNSPGQVGLQFLPLTTLVYKLGKVNLAVIAGAGPSAADYSLTSGQLWKLRVVSIPAALTCSFLLAALAGIISAGPAGREKMKKNPGPLSALALWLIYFCVIYEPRDRYPLHEMRHHLYFLLPFAYLFVLGLCGCESAARGRPGRRAAVFYALCWGGIAAYAALNARAALGLGGELRTDDRELAFLMKAQKAWPPGCLAVYPLSPQAGYNSDLIKKYFPVLPECARADNRCLFKYVAPEPDIFYSVRESLLEQAPLTAGPRSVPWQAITFNHGFYTNMPAAAPERALPGPSTAAIPAPAGIPALPYGLLPTEVKEPRPLTIGFFKLENAGRDKALLDTLAGDCAFDSGDYYAANKKYREALAADPSCLSCGYSLAVSYAALGEKAAAGRELEKIRTASPSALLPEHRALIAALAERDEDRAQAITHRLEARDPGIFTRLSRRGGIRRLCGSANRN